MGPIIAQYLNSDVAFRNGAYQDPCIRGPIGAGLNHKLKIIAGFVRNQIGLDA
jgi:hypothetical protein